MNALLAAEPRPAAKTLTPGARSNLLQRKCACDGKSATDAASSRPLRGTANPSPPDAMPEPGHDFGLLQVHSHTRRHFLTKLAVSQPDDPYENEAERASEQVIGALSSRLIKEKQPVIPLSHAPLLVQRAVDDDAAPTAAPETAPTAEPDASGPTEASAAGLVVEDEAQGLVPGQMHKSEFLDELQNAVCTAADAELAAVGQSTEGCPYIKKWFGYYRTRTGSQVERAVQKYVPEASGVKAASDYISLITEQARRSTAAWAKTGEITGVPEGAPMTPPAAGAVEGTSESKGSAPTLVQTKSHGPRTPKAEEPIAVRAQLGSGYALEDRVKSRMETAFGVDFSRVRVHTDASAARSSTNLNARAFTVGRDIAFAQGEYRPGTLVGDALIAHELAHVIQQGDSDAMISPKGAMESSALEEDADVSAVGAVLSLWGMAKGQLARLAKKAMPRLKSGLRLARCSCSMAGGLEVKPFCINDAPTNPTYKAAVKADIDKLNTTTQGRGAMSALVGGSTIDIKYLSGSAQTQMSRSTIFYDPSYSGRPDQCPPPLAGRGWNSSPGYVFLFHEITHAYLDRVEGKSADPDSECMATGLGKYFTSTPYNENQLRCELNFPVRPCYDDVCKLHPPPTCGGATPEAPKP